MASGFDLPNISRISGRWRTSPHSKDHPIVKMALHFLISFKAIFSKKEKNQSIYRKSTRRSLRFQCFFNEQTLKMDGTPPIFGCLLTWAPPYAVIGIYDQGPCLVLGSTGSDGRYQVLHPVRRASVVYHWHSHQLWSNDTFHAIGAVNLTGHFDGQIRPWCHNPAI